jgi:hypothetical protein
MVLFLPPLLIARPFISVGRFYEPGLKKSGYYFDEFMVSPFHSGGMYEE